MANLVPPIDITQDIYSEQVIILRKGGNVLGRIVAHYPTDQFGGPDMEGPRPPIFYGCINLIGVSPDGREARIPLEFHIEETDPIIACSRFPDLAQAAVDEFQSENFRKTLVMPDGRPQ